MYDHIKNLIAEDQVKEAISMLRNTLTGHPRENEILQHDASLSALEKRVRTDLLSFEEINRQENKIRQNLLELIQDIEYGNSKRLGVSIGNTPNLYLPKSLPYIATLLFFLLSVWLFSNLSIPTDNIPEKVKMTTEGDGSDIIWGRDIEIHVQENAPLEIAKDTTKEKIK